MGEENLTAKLKKFIEKHGWLVIILLFVAVIVLVASLLYERGKKGKREE
ncbi:MAG: hypothetical protein QMD23_03790 [Candidatus Bathyarchaeia archaeon]|nr:hypothetical protein [Candidatus Bathyarchaeia archaeon]